MSTPTSETPAGTQLATVPAMLPSLSFLSSTLLFSLAAVQVRAGRMHWLQPCNPAHQKLQQGTFQFQTDCDDTTYCAANSTCVRRGCRSDDYPFGYPPNVTVPPKCGKGSFCPDEESRCQKLLPVGSACQFNRDGECLLRFVQRALPWGVRSLRRGNVKMNARARPTSRSSWTRPASDSTSTAPSACTTCACTSLPLSDASASPPSCAEPNVSLCRWANVTVGRPCAVQNTAYTAYGPRGEFVHIVSRCVLPCMEIQVRHELLSHERERSKRCGRSWYETT